MTVTNCRHPLFRLVTTRGSVRWSVQSQTASGWLTFVVTPQVARPGSKIPSKVCHQCGDCYPCVAFLKRWRVLPNGYLVWTDAPTCPACHVPTSVPLHMDDAGKLRMWCEMRESNGAPIRLWDRSRKRWLCPKTLGIRKMTGIDELRLQPYTDRKPGSELYGGGQA